MDNAWTDVAKGENHTLVRFASGPSPLSDVGGGALLKGEAAGWATDFLYDADPTKRVALKTPPASKTFYAVDDFIANTNTSPKTVYDAAGVLRWSPHNLMVQSQTFLVPWGSNAFVITANAIAAPNGAMQGYAFAPTAGSQSPFVNQPPAMPNGAVVTVSVYVKNGTLGSTWFLIQSDASAYFNLVTGVKGSSTAISSNIVAVGNGWYRCDMTFTAASAASQIYFCTASSDGFGASCLIGDSVKPAFYLWGPQLNRGFTPLAYVSTLGVMRCGCALDYDPLTHAPLGMLIEPQATNLCYPSAAGKIGQEWLGNSSTRVGGKADPAGGFEALEVTFLSAGGMNVSNTNSTLVAGTVYTASMWCKGVAGQQAYFTIDSTALPAMQKLITFTGNWQRVFHTYTASASGAAYIGFENYNRSGGAHLPLITMQCWGGQYEAGNIAPSDIPTLAATVTRAGDVNTCSIQAAAINYSATAGSWWAEHYTRPNHLSGWLVGHNTTNAPIFHGDHYYGLTCSTTTFYKEAGAAGLGSINKVMSAFTNGNSAVTFNGQAPDQTDTNPVTNLFTAPVIVFGCGAGGNVENGYIRQLRYLPRRPSNAEMRTMTALTGGKALLAAEANGMATDFIYVTDTERVAVKTAGAVKEFGLDAFYQNTGGSPKQVFTIDGKLGWSPHNLELWSEDFTNAAWVKGDSSVIANAITAPDGTLTADKFVEGTGGASKYLQQYGARASNGVFSVYAKAGERTKIVLQDWLGGAIGDGFDLVAGVVHVLDLPTLRPTGRSTIKAVGNGWYRCSIGVVTGGDCAIYTADDNWAVSHPGDGVSGLYVWGAQLNYGSALVPYIPTTSAAKAGLALDYDPLTHAAKGLLCEPQATNTIKSSTDMTNAAVWWGDGVSELNAGVAPNGLMEALKFSGDGLGAYESGNFLSGAIPGTITGNVSVYAKAGSTSQFFMMSGSNIAEGFDLATGTVFVPTEHGNPYASSGLGVMRNVGNGWWRCSCPATALGDFWMGLCRNKEMVSQGAELSMYLWGPQGDSVNPFPTSYIPTFAAAVTRAADDIAVPTTAFPFSLTNLSMAGDIVDNIPAITADFFSVCGSDGVLTESIGLYSAGFYVRHAFAYQALISAAGVIRKVAVAAAAADFRAAFDAALGLPSTTGAMPTYAGTSVRIGGAVAIGGVHGNFYLKKYTIVPRSWTNAELQAMTT